jgi:galactokinase
VIPGPGRSITAFAPGRVNLIGDHTDYTGGWALPMAIQLGTTVTLAPGGDRVRLSSSVETATADVGVDVVDPAAEDGWVRYVAGVVAELRPPSGGVGNVTTSLPIGAGLSSSAALEVALALALGFTGTPLELAMTCQRAEQRASGVPCGLMDQLASAAGVEGHALLLDCATNSVEPVRVPEGCEVVAVHSGRARTLADSDYAERRRQCEAAAAEIGPLRDATVADLKAVVDPTDRRRAHHVITENGRVLAFVDALKSGDLEEAGALMVQSHESLKVDFAVSTPGLDELVADLISRRGVHGARLTGAGFGGCVVALTEPGVLDLGWRLTPSGGAHVVPA